jgi:hypothetical protein
MTDAEGTKLPDVILSHELAEYESRAQLYGYDTERQTSATGVGNWLSVRQITKDGSVSCAAFDGGSIIANATSDGSRPHAMHMLAQGVTLMLARVFNVRQGVPKETET